MKSRESHYQLTEIELETLCHRCQGKGGEIESRTWYSCSECDGAGYLPTELGKKVLAMMRHNFRPMLENAQRDV